MTLRPAIDASAPPRRRATNARSATIVGAAMLLVVVMAAGCTAAASRRSPNATPPDITLPLLWARTAAEHDAAYAQTFASATNRLERLAPRGKRSQWAVVLDVDETILDDSEFRLHRLGIPYDDADFQNWCANEAARALPGARRFLERVHALGGRIALVTNRDERVCEHTRNNLRKEKLPFDEILCRRETSDKNARFDAIQSGQPPSTLPPQRILLWLGDNIEDFPGIRQRQWPGNATTLLPRFGVDYFILPNPVYGSWMSNALR